MDIDYKLSEIPEVNDDVEMWYVVGIPDVCYPTKIVAEKAARVTFPNEHPDRQYARIFYRTYTRAMSWEQK